MVVAPLSINIDGRVRLSRGSVDRQTAHVQPIIGTPWDVPVPRKVTLVVKLLIVLQIRP
jgi:hypothetical protein